MIAQPAHVPHGSFLNTPAPTSASLCRQVVVDPVLRVRLKHALHLSTDAAVIHLAKSLHREPLTCTRILKVYYTRQGGAWGYKIRRVAAGTPVFAGTDHSPRLMQVCGNPVEIMSPAKVSRPNKVAKFTPKESEVGMVVEPDKIPTPPVQTAVSAELAPPVAQAPAALSDSFIASVPTSTAGSAVLPAPAFSGPVGGGSGGGSGLGWLLAGLIPLSFLHGSHGSTSTPAVTLTPTGTSSGSTLGTATGSTPVTNPGGSIIVTASAPEPSAAILMAPVLAMVALGRGIVRRRRVAA